MVEQRNALIEHEHTKNQEIQEDTQTINDLHCWPSASVRSSPSLVHFVRSLMASFASFSLCLLRSL